MNRRIIAVVALALVGCVPPPVSLKVEKPALLPYVATGKVLLVRAPIDRRPAAEVRGATAAWRHFVPLVLINFVAIQGSEVSGAARFEPSAWQSLHQGLAEHTHATGLFSEVKYAGPADYILDTEVLHLGTAMYRAFDGFFGAGAGFGQHKLFAPHATVAWRLRLRDGEGRVLAERVVSASAMGQAGETAEVMSHATSPALKEALRKSRLLVAAWVREREEKSSTDALVAALDGEHTKGHSLLLHMVNEDRSRVFLARVSCPGGNTRDSSAPEGLPVVGRPGEWLLSPFDEHGVRLPSRAYDALSRHAAMHFDLKRIDQVAVYHYLGPRTGAAPAVASPARDPEPPPAVVATAAPAPAPQVVTPAPAPAAPVASEPKAVPVVVEPKAIVETVPAPAETRPPVRPTITRRNGTWLVVAGVAAVGAAGLTVAGALQDPKDAARSHDRSAFDDVKTTQTVLYGVAGALGGLAALSMIGYFTFGEEVPSGGMAVRVGPGPGVAGLSLGGRF